MDVLWEKYKTGEITKEEFNKKRNQFFELSMQQREKDLLAIQEGTKEAKEVFGLPPSVPVTPYRPISDIPKARLEAYNSIVGSRMYEYGDSREAAESFAREEINKVIRPATAEFYTQPDIGTSRIVDVEKGLVTDEETGEIRSAEGMELLTEAFGRQRLGTIAQVEATEAAAKARVEAEKKLRTDYKAEYVRVAREKQARKQAGLLIDDTVELDLEGAIPLGFDVAAIETKERDILPEDIPAMTEEEIQEWLRQQAAQEKREDIEVLPEGSVQRALTEPVYTAGIVRETQLGRGLRAFNTLPAVVAAGGEYLLPDIEETETYRMADSADVVDQIAVNIAKMQGLPELFEATPGGKKALEDLLGEGGAWWAGMFVEFPIPVGPGLALKAYTKGMTGVGRAVGKGGEIIGAGKVSAPVAEAIEAVGSPYQYYLLRAEMARTDEMLQAVGSEKSAREIVNQYYDKPFERADWVDASLKRNNLSEVAADTMAERLSVLHTIRAGLDAQGTIKVADLGTINSTSTGRAILAAVQSGSDKPIEALTRANAGEIVIREINTFKEAAKSNRDFARIYNEAQDIQKQITAAGKQTGIPQRIRPTKLSSEFQSEMGRVSLARQIASGAMSKEDIAKFILKSRQKNIDLNSPTFWKEFLENPRIYKELTGEDVGRVMLDQRFGLGNLEIVQQAMQNTLKVPIRENILNFLPQNLSVVAGGTVVNTSRLKGKQYKAFQKELKSRNQGITFDGDKGVFRVSKKDGRELITDLIEYAGLDRVRQSDSFRKMIDDLARGEITYKNRDMIDKVIKSTAAMKHLDAFKLREAGDQYRRALAAPEARGDIIALSEGKEFGEQISRGAFGQIAKDVVSGWKALRSQRTGLFPEVGVNVNADFIQLEKRTNDIVDTVYSQFDKDFKAKSKQLKSPVAALDEMGLDAYQMRREPFVQAITTAIDRGFDGSSVEYLNTFVKPRYRQQILDEVARLERAGKTADIEQLVYDYGLYFIKLDSWQEMLNTYFGPAKMESRFPNSSGLRKFLQPEGAQSLRPTESLIADLTYTNFTNVANAIQERYGLQTLRTSVKVIPTKASLKGIPTPPIPFIEFILGSRRGDVVSKLQAEWIDQNPNYRLEYYPQYTSLNMEVNLRPLTAKYDDMFVRTFEALEQANISVNRDYLRSVSASLGRTLANKHFELVTRVSPTQRAKIVNRIRTMIEEKNTLDPDLFSMRRELESILDFPKATLDRMIEEIIKDVITVGDVPLTGRQLGGPKPKGNKAVVDNIIQEAKDDVWRIFFDGKPPDGTYYGDPSLSVVQDTLDDLKRFYRANGLAVGDDLVNGLTENLPLLKRIRNTEYAGLYGDQVAKSFEQMYDIAGSTKLRTMINSLRKADPKSGEVLGNMLSNSISWLRRSMTQGMLGGWPAPGTRYIGVNILSGPIIMMGTVGLQRTLKTLGSRRAFAAMRQATSITQIPDAKVVFTSKGGRAYTAKELRMMEDQFNLGLTRGQVEFYEGQARETLRSGGMKITGEQINPKWATLLSQIDPSQRNLFSKFADASDLTYRRATFYSALADDMPIDQAVDLAKKSLLDYGAMSAKEKEVFNRYTMFWSFARQILSETINATYKSVVGDAGHNYLASVIRASQKQQNEAGAWLEGNDAAHARLFAIFKEQIDGRAAYSFGLSNPYVESYETFVNIAMMCAAPMFGEEQVEESVLKFFKDGQTRPVIDFAMKTWTDKHSSTVPPEIIYAAKAFDVWPQFKQFFGIETRPIGERRIQKPVWGDYEEQYYLPDKEKNRFARYMLALTLVGVSRNIRDYSKAAMAGDMQEGVDVKRYGTPTPTGYLFGLETSLPQKDILDMYFQERSRIDRDLIKLYKE